MAGIYTQHVTPKEALIVKEWNITAKTFQTAGVFSRVNTLNFVTRQLQLGVFLSFVTLQRS